MTSPAELRLAIDAGDDGHLYDAVTAWWRTVRHPRIAEVAIAIARRAGAYERPAVGGMKNADHDRWVALAKAGDPFDLPRLLSSLSTTNSVLGLRRLSAVEADDPHIVPGVFALLRKPPSRNHGAKPLWLYACERMTATPDVRIRAELDDYLPQIATFIDTDTGDWLRRRLTEVLVKMPVHPPALDADDDRALGELERALAIKPPSPSRIKRSATDVLAQIYADPDDGGAREVYADIVGGEIGEFIVGQLHGSTVQPTVAVANALLGALTGIASRATFVRGFPEELSIWKQRPTTIRPAIGLPGWALVQAIEITHAGWVWPEDVQRAAVKLLMHPVMSRLESLTGVALPSLARLATMPAAASLETLGVVSGHDGAEHAAALDAFPALATLQLTAWHQGPFAIPATVLARLDLMVTDSPAYSWWNQLSASPLPRFRIELNGMRLDFARTATGLDDAVLEVLRPNAIINLVLLPRWAIRAILVRNPYERLAETIAAQLAHFTGAVVRHE